MTRDDPNKKQVTVKEYLDELVRQHSEIKKTSGIPEYILWSSSAVFPRDKV